MDRYSRQIALPEFGRVAQEQLQRGRVLCVGLGGLGGPAATYLVAAGVGTVGLIDGDRVELSNLQRQVLFRTDEIGTDKVEAASVQLRALNPNVAIVTHPGRLTSENARDIFQQYDVVVDGTDNFSARYLINDIARRLALPVIFGSVLRGEGRITVFSPPGPCYRCLFPRLPAPEDYPSCSEAGVLGPLPGMIGAWQAGEAIKCLTNLGTSLRGRLLRFDFWSGSFTEYQLTPDLDCPTCRGDETIERGPAECDWSDIEDKGLLLIDVREPEEFAAGHVIGSENIPLYRLTEFFAKQTPCSRFAVYCQSGKRSEKAARMIFDAGFREVWSVRGGINSYLGHEKLVGSSRSASVKEP